MNVIELMKDLVGKKPAEVTAKELQLKIAEVKRTATKYEGNAYRAEKEALQLRAQAFEGDQDARQKAVLIRKAKSQYDAARRSATQAGTFIDQMASLSEVLLVKEIAEEFRGVGLLNGAEEIENWQQALDELTIEVQESVREVQGLTDGISAIQLREENDPQSEAEVDELEDLFRRLKKAEQAEDPAEAQKVQELIDRKAGLAF